VSDIFQEVEEEVRRDRYAELWKQYGDYVVAGVALVIIAVAGFQLWTRYESNQRQKASENLIVAQQLADAGDTTRANEALATVVKDAPFGSSYDEVARMSEAGVLLGSGKRDEAIEIYKSVAAKDHGPMGDVARIRAGWAMAEVASREDLDAMLKPLVDPKNTWHSAAGEILAFADYRAGHLAAARTEFEAISKDKDAPESLRRRAEVMADFIKNGGLANQGTVPPPPPPTAAPVPAAGPATAPAPTDKTK
jgi:hypothetical protein